MRKRKWERRKRNIFSLQDFKIKNISLSPVADYILLKYIYFKLSVNFTMHLLGFLPIHSRLHRCFFLLSMTLFSHVVSSTFISVPPSSWKTEIKTVGSELCCWTFTFLLSSPNPSYPPPWRASSRGTWAAASSKRGGRPAWCSARTPRHSFAPYSWVRSLSLHPQTSEVWRPLLEH